MSWWVGPVLLMTPKNKVVVIFELFCVIYYYYINQSLFAYMYVQLNTLKLHNEIKIIFTNGNRSHIYYLHCIFS